MSLVILHGDHRVAQFEQIFLLHGQQLLADLLGLRFSGECDYDEITHGQSSSKILFLISQPWRIHRSAQIRRKSR